MTDSCTLGHAYLVSMLGVTPSEASVAEVFAGLSVAVATLISDQAQGDAAYALEGVRIFNGVVRDLVERTCLGMTDAAGSA